MAHVTREFTFDVYRVRAGETGVAYVYEETFAVEVRAQLQRSCSMGGFIHCLGTLQLTVGTWLRNAWHQRLIITPDQRHLADQLRSSCGREPFATVTMTGDLTANLVCDHLLAEVCEPRLRAHGMMADLVRCRIMGHDWTEASLAETYVQRYLARHPMPPEHDQNIHLPAGH